MPRTKRSSKIIEPPPPPAKPEPPECARCGRELDWRDRFYVPAPKPADDAAAASAEGSKPSRRKKKPTATPSTPRLCKRCYQRGQHARVRFVAFHPAPVVNRTSRRSFGHFADDRITAYGEHVTRQKQAKRTLAARRVARTRVVA